MNVDHFRKYIVRDSLKAAKWWSPAVENIILGTGLVESNLENLIQIGCGVARGIYQIEPRSYADVLTYIKRDPDKVSNILTSCSMTSLPEDVNAVIWNLRYATLITRMFYYRVPEALPKSDDAIGLTQYYIQHYNCGGKATIERDLPIFKQVCENKEW